MSRKNSETPMESAVNQMTGNEPENQRVSTYLPAQGTDNPPEPVKQRRGLDPEIQCMAKIDRILADLDQDAKARIINWLANRNCLVVLARRIESVSPLLKDPKIEV